MIEKWANFNFKGTLYKVSNAGRVSKYNNKILKTHIDRDGYCRVRLTDITKLSKDKRKSKLLHRLVFKAFNPLINIEGLTINHDDGNKLNNLLNNLSVMSFGDNNRHAYKTGLKNNQGIRHGKAHFTEENILKIRDMYKNGVVQQKIADSFNVSQARISEIITRKTWKHI